MKEVGSLHGRTEQTGQRPRLSVGPGKGRYAMLKTSGFVVLGLVLVVLLVSLRCAPGNERWDQKTNPGQRAGFWVGLWHGLIIIVTFVVSLFTDQVGLYEISNTGWPYNLGFMLGLFCSIGGGVHVRRRHRRKKWRVKKDEWEEIAEKVEVKVREGMKSWLEKTSRDEKEQEWAEIGEKIEEKIREALRKWAEKE
jgi:hypothetical protein